MKVKWANEGDIGSRLFFKIVSGRKMKNYVRKLEGDEG